jgi:hypothetical protein
MTKADRWDELADRIDDEVLDTLAVCGRPDDIGRLVATRYGDTVDRVGLSMPYDVPAETLTAVVAGFAPTRSG